MDKTTPVVYLLHGEDEFAIAQYLAELEARLGDSATAAMNTTRLDGRSYNPDELLSVAGVMPFLAKRRLVVLTHPLTRLTTPGARDSFCSTLERIPASTALVLVEYRLLTDERDRRKGKINWLEKWAEAHKERVYMKVFPRLKGQQMIRWIQDRARAAGGQFTTQAAAALEGLVGDDPRLADSEIHKLLAYVDYRRPVEPDDVERLTADYDQGDIFIMVDALGGRDGKKALGMLHRLMETQDPYAIFGMIARQFRLLLLAREMLEAGKGSEIARELKVHPFVAEKIAGQARHFTLQQLETVYSRLVSLDEAMKTSLIEGDVALDTFVAAFTNA